MMRRPSPKTPPQPPRAYERTRDLPRLLPLWPHELHTPEAAAHGLLLARIRRALRQERQRGTAGHWAYDLARHAGLLRVYRAEVAAYLSRKPSRLRIIKAPPG